MGFSNWLSMQKAGRYSGDVLSVWPVTSWLSGLVATFLPLNRLFSGSYSALRVFDFSRRFCVLAVMQVGGYRPQFRPHRGVIVKAGQSTPIPGVEVATPLFACSSSDHTPMRSHREDRAAALQSAAVIR